MVTSAVSLKEPRDNLSDNIWDEGSCHTTYFRKEHGKGYVGYFDEIVLGHFRGTEDSIRESVAVISDVEGRVDRSIPPQIVGDLGPT